MEKGGDGRPLFLLRARSAYRFLPAFFFPPLAFFAIVFYPPLHLGFTRHIVSGCRLARSRDCNRASCTLVTRNGFSKPSSYQM